MALDLYAACPCGSGKKFKWCCAPIHAQLEKAFQLDADGQHDAALRVIDEVVAANPTNPEAWGRKAQLLYQMERAEDAEAALEKAFEVSPGYPFGHYLRGRFRHAEGELAGALLLFRKAVDLYAPEAQEMLAQIHALIAESELKMNRPVAARAALQMAIRNAPTNPDFPTGMKEVFGPESQLPEPARREYVFQSAAAAAPERKAAWEAALVTAATGKLTDAARAFEQLTAANGDDAAAWYNLGLTHAWLGDNARALEALDRYVQLEADEDKAGAAWALAEVLRLGHGMEDQADHVEYIARLPMRQPQQAINALGQYDAERRLMGTQVRQEEGIITAMILEKVTALTPDAPAAQMPRLGASLLVMSGIFHLWSANRENLDKIVAELRQRAGPSLGEPQGGRVPANFQDVLSAAVAFPVNAVSEEDAKQKVTAYMAGYFEEKWLHQPLLSLNRVPPVDAAGHGTLRKKLRGVIQFLQECARLSAHDYDFDRLRRKLGLLGAAPAAQAAAAGTAAQDFGVMSAAELAGVAVEPLGDAEVEEAFQAALKLDARDLAGRFAKEIVNRPARAERPDRYRWHTHLIQQAAAGGDHVAALDLLNEGEKDDCEHNEGRRRNDYELRRGQMLAKRGDMDEAQSAFEKLIERAPAELLFRSTAAETMLSAKQGARARRFAEEGLAKARQLNNRDSEEHFKELVSAAQRQGG